MVRVLFYKWEHVLRAYQSLARTHDGKALSEAAVQATAQVLQEINPTLWDGVFQTATTDDHRPLVLLTAHQAWMCDYMFFAAL